MFSLETSTPNIPWTQLPSHVKGLTIYLMVLEFLRESYSYISYERINQEYVDSIWMQKNCTP